MKVRVASILKNLIAENLSYKVVSLLIALILWLTILGRRDFIVTRNLEVELLVGAGQNVISQSSNRVKVRVSGPKTALRRFMDSGAAQVISIDLASRTDGMYEVEIPANKVDLPFGVKLVSMQPKAIQVQIGKKEQQ